MFVAVTGRVQLYLTILGVFAISFSEPHDYRVVFYIQTKRTPFGVLFVLAAALGFEPR